MNVLTLLFLFGLFLLTLAVSLSAWVLVDWLRECRTIRELRSRARLRRILHRKGPGQVCRRHA